MKEINSDIYSFIYFLAENNYKTNSRVVKTDHLRTFFDYLYTIKHTIFTEPFKKIKCERKNKNSELNIKEIQFYPFSRQEIDELITNYNKKCKLTDIRNNAILHLFLNCGLRQSEVSNLNIDDINLNESRFRIIGKGNKERTGYLNKNTRIALEEYLKIRKEMDIQTNALFVSNYNERISSTSLKRIVKIAYILSNIDDEIYSVHTLRHTCATLLYKTGINIKTIQILLGHVQIDTTEIYTHLHNEEVQEAMLGHPLSKFKIHDALAFVA